MKQMPKKYVVVLLCLFMINTFAIHKVIAEDQEDYLEVTGPCNLTFPKDHGFHPGYRTEWWYYTGNLISESGDRYGYQLTFFRRQISPPGASKTWPRPPSSWRTQQIFFGHFAISNISDKRHLQAELISRAALGMAGVSQQSAATTVFVRNWSAKIGAESHILTADTGDFSIDLILQPTKPSVLQGQAGCHRKGRAKEQATCYYSLTRLISKGFLKIDG
jgi:predicted secreted hydrolase